MTTNTTKPKPTAQVLKLPAQYRTHDSKPVKEWTPADIAARLETSALGPDADFLEVTRLMGDSAANGDKNDPVVVSGKSELALRRLVDRFAFDRLPLTFGELNGFLDYALFIQSASGSDIANHPYQRQLWEQAALSTCERHNPEWLPGLKLFLAGDLAGLRAYHRDNNVMHALGQAYVEEFDDE